MQAPIGAKQISLSQRARSSCARVQHRKRIEKIKDRFGLGDGGLGREREHHRRLQRDAELDAHKRPGRERSLQIGRYVIGERLMDRHIERDLGISHAVDTCHGPVIGVTIVRHLVS